MIWSFKFTWHAGGFWAAISAEEQPNNLSTLRGRRMKKSSASEIVGVLAIQVVDASGRWQVAGPLFFLKSNRIEGRFSEVGFYLSPC